MRKCWMVKIWTLQKGDEHLYTKQTNDSIFLNFEIVGAHFWQNDLTLDKTVFKNSVLPFPP